MTIEARRKRAMDIWLSGTAAVSPFEAIRRNLSCRRKGDSAEIRIQVPRRESAVWGGGKNPEELVYTVPPQGRVICVGFGKASGAMADACESLLAPVLEENQLTGWINVPENQVRNDCLIHRHGGRPAGVNEPTETGRFGAEQILALIDSAGPDDLILTLVSGGGSALLPLPVPEISLVEKTAVTRFLSGAGANIIELNTVRGALSQVKSGGLLRRAAGKRLVSLLISDVLGNPLSIIAGGATVPAVSTTSDALAVLNRFGGEKEPELASILSYLRQKSNEPAAETDYSAPALILADNETAVLAAGNRARQEGLSVITESASASEGLAEQTGIDLLRQFRALIRSGKASSLISGGEPVVELAPSAVRGLGGRNQQLVLTAFIETLRRPEPEDEKILFLSAGTDGEDGPTDAAGAFFDAELAAQVRQAERNGTLHPEDFLARNDAYHFFEHFRALIQTGPTGTNVCDLRVCLG